MKKLLLILLMLCGCKPAVNTIHRLESPTDGNWCVITDTNGVIVERFANFSISNGVVVVDPASVAALKVVEQQEAKR